MAHSASGKGDLRGAAERLERGIDRYGEGDLPGALVEFEEALRLYPASARGKQFVAWVRDVQAGRRDIQKRVPTLDEDAVRAVSEALEDSPSMPSPQSMEQRPRSMTPAPPVAERPRSMTPAPPVAERPRRMTPAPPVAERPRSMTPSPQPSPSMAERPRSMTPAPPPSMEERPRRLTPTPMETAATMQLAKPPQAPVTRREGGESPWDPVPLTPSGHEVPPELRGQRHKDLKAELQSATTKAAPPPGRVEVGSSSTILGMPPLEPRLLTPHRRHVAEDRPESVTREFRSATPTGPGLRPLDVPELTDEQIQGLLALDSPLIPESRTAPQIELDRIDPLDGLDDSQEQRLIELEAVPTPLPHSTPVKVLRKNDTNPMGVESFSGEFDPTQLTPTGVKPQGLKPMREASPDDDPYADLNLLPLEVAPDLGGPDEVEEGGTNPTNPFIRGAKLAQYTSYGSSAEVKLEDMPPLPSLPGTRTPAHALSEAEAALNSGDLLAAVDACEAVLAKSGGLTGATARDQLPLVEQIYGALLGGPNRVPVHGQATGDLEPRSAFLLSRLDGSMTVEDVLDVSGMPRLEALRVLALLVRRGTVIIK